ncbi:alpha-1B-glycoprotein isoform X1 [Microcaecilia unicolor]|uniref:Alpha-1B-glycoprotein-like isoform X1 n=1 Tax=Microcaecilia unicolor TaxID=1415580 RepID=A0A6P7WRL7_9AMPH|nr:alpha-1B-glycoprotein-like isoform X1 [Microcaecilia unicolor]
MIPLIATILACISASCLLTVEVVGDSPAAPSIVFEPEFTVYIINADHVILRCVAPSPSKVGKYLFYHDGALRKNVTENVHSIAPVIQDSRGSYFCVYYTLDGNMSLESAIRTLRVIERPPTPDVSFRPQQPVYVKGEQVNVVCTGSKASSGVYYHFYKDGRQLTLTKGQPEAVHQIPDVQEGNAGFYVCQYGIEDSGRAISTLESSQKTLTVIDPLPAPLLSIDPVPAIAGVQVTVTCEAASASTVNGYRFYKDGREITEPQGSTQDTYILNNFSGADQGSYFCLYWRNTSGREIRSPESPKLRLNSEGNISESKPSIITDETSSSPSVTIVYLFFFGGKLFVFIVVLLVFGCCQIHQNRKMKTQRQDQ